MNSYTKLSALLKDKIEAAGNFDIAKLDDIMKEEQKYLLITRGFDQNIENFKKELNLKGDTLGEAVDGMPADVRPRFAEIHAGLSEALNAAKSLNGECQALLKVRLQEIDKKLGELGKPADPQAAYPNPKNPASGNHSFSKSV